MKSLRDQNFGREKVKTTLLFNTKLVSKIHNYLIIIAYHGILTDHAFNSSIPFLKFFKRKLVKENNFAHLNFESPSTNFFYCILLVSITRPLAFWAYRERQDRKRRIMREI